MSRTQNTSLNFKVTKCIFVPVLIALVAFAFIDRYEKKNRCEAECRKLGYSESIFSGTRRKLPENCICVDPDKPSIKLKLSFSEDLR